MMKRHLKKTYLEFEFSYLQRLKKISSSFFISSTFYSQNFVKKKRYIKKQHLTL